MSEKSPENTESPKVETDKSPHVQPGNKKSPVIFITLVVLIISFLFLIWYVLSDRHVPYTDQARINGLLVPVVPNVSGYLTKVNVGLHSEIKIGDTLFQIDQRPFHLEIEIAEANLDNTVQSVAGKTATVKSAAGRLGVARAQLERAQRDWNRVQIVLNGNPGALSQADKDQSETGLLQATEQVTSAEADLERAEQNLGISGDQNASFRASVKALERAQLNLAYTSIISSTAGYLESFSIDLGYFASTGQPLATIVSGFHKWIQADMKENNISLMKPGNKVEILLDILPGKIFTGKVESIGFGVSTGNTNKGDLPSISGAKGWLRDPQRFPVIISIDENSMIPVLRHGGQVDVVVFTDDKKGFLAKLGKLRIRIISWLSYVR
jgi:multidrug resistance efflux pump